MVSKTNKIIISISDFIGFVNKSGGSKMTKVKQLKSRDKYHPSKDFYKSIREEIVDIHQRAEEITQLDDLMNKIVDAKKKKNFPTVIEGYKKFIGKRKSHWFEPPVKHWIIGDLDIKINPELGLFIGQRAFVIKMFLSSEKITKDKIIQILSLMESELRTSVQDNVIFAILDVKTGKLHENSSKDVSYLPLLEGEARSFETIWRAIN